MEILSNLTIRQIELLQVMSGSLSSVARRQLLAISGSLTNSCGFQRFST